MSSDRMLHGRRTPETRASSPGSHNTRTRRLLRACRTSAACYALARESCVPLCTHGPERTRYPRSMGKRAPSFNAQAFLDSAGLSKQIVEYGRDEAIFSQGDRCESVMYI